LDFLADVNDVKLIRYPLFYDHGWHIDMHGLKQAATPRTRGIIVVHPNNPTGHFTRPEEVAQLNQICSDNQMAVIADEVFLDFSLGVTAKSFVANTGALTFTMSGISKISGLPQMKLAWLVAGGPEAVKREALARLEMIADTYLSLNAPIQLAAPVLLQQRAAFQRQLMARVRRNLAELDAQLTKEKRFDRLNVEGGWYAVLRVPARGPRPCDLAKRTQSRARRSRVPTQAPLRGLRGFVVQPSSKLRRTNPIKPITNPRF
jgi:aspartate/methionine/tyrosine aminotransferase